MEDRPPPPRAPLDEALLGRVARWLPLAFAGHLIVGLPTLLISLVVAYGTYVQAQATQRMQQAAAWPFIAYNTSNYDDAGRHSVILSLANNGVGPAVLGPVEVRYAGRPMRNPSELLAACCGYREGAMQLGTAPLANAVIRPGERLSFFTFVDVPANAAMIAPLERERWKFDVRACYCSIFDDCWITRGVQGKPQSVAACPVNWTVFGDR